MRIEDAGKYWAKLDDIQRTRPNGEANQGVFKALQQLALEAGADPLQTGSDYHVSVPELVRRIHQALQTAAMIYACQTAAKDHEVALTAQGSARLSQWISVVAMLAAVAVAIAAWVWH